MPLHGPTDIRPAHCTRRPSDGTTVTYSLFGLAAFLQGHTNLGTPTDRIDMVGQIVLASAVLLLIWWGGRRSRVAVRV